MENNNELKEIRARAYAHWSRNKDWNFLWYIAYYDKKNHIITEEEKQAALKEWEQLKEEKRNSVKKGEFMLCPMWMDKEGDFNNHRARAEVLAKNWNKYLFELTTFQRKGEEERLHLECSLNLTEEKFYNNKLIELKEKNKDEPHRWNWSIEDQEERNKYFKQPYYWHETEKAREFLKDKPATKQTAIELVNYLYGTNFKTLEISDLIEPEFVNID